MNPLAAQQVKDILANVEALRRELANARQQLDAAAESREEVQRQAWSQSRELHVFRDQMKKVAELSAENEQYRLMTREFEQRLRDILRCTQALTVQLRQ